MDATSSALATEANAASKISLERRASSDVACAAAKVASTCGRAASSERLRRSMSSCFASRSASASFEAWIACATFFRAIRACWVVLATSLAFSFAALNSAVFSSITSVAASKDFSAIGTLSAALITSLSASAAAALTASKNGFASLATSRASSGFSFSIHFVARFVQSCTIFKFSAANCKESIAFSCASLASKQARRTCSTSSKFTSSSNFSGVVGLAGATSSGGGAASSALGCPSSSSSSEG
mmetsp:Transcript_126655/g.405530  ORF Transcript_126655/g.405530 Transcript_126655/m.405530 type:complete len:243 (+) Transcript_126655:804-1532(+)